MANACTAGVMFTIHPANGDRSVIVIDSNFGFGESVVSGEVTPDHFVVNKITLDIIDRTISQNRLRHGGHQDAGGANDRIPFERQKVQSLIDDEITELAWMGKQIEKHYGRAMDIEWAVDKDLPPAATSSSSRRGPRRSGETATRAPWPAAPARRWTTSLGDARPARRS